MLNDAESAERRALHHRAYGRDAVFTADELHRLRELDEKASTPPPAETLESSARSVERAGVSPRSVERAGGETKRAEQAERVEAPATPSRFRWPLLAAAFALVIGVAAGWMLWGRPADGIPLTDEQREWQALLVADQAYDPGSVLPVAQAHGTVAWKATKDLGEQTCVLLSNGTQRSSSCGSTDVVRERGIWGELEVPSDEENTVGYQQAVLRLTAQGDPIAAIDGFLMVTSSEPRYANQREEELSVALLERGYLASRSWVIGYYEQEPIWVAQTGPTAGDACMIYFGDRDEPLESCADEESGDDGIRLVFDDVVDGEPREVEVFYGNGSRLPSMLTVTVRPATGRD